MKETPLADRQDESTTKNSKTFGDNQNHQTQQDLTPEEELLEQTGRDFKISIIFKSIINNPKMIRQDISH